MVACEDDAVSAHVAGHAPELTKVFRIDRLNWLIAPLALERGRAFG